MSEVTLEKNRPFRVDIEKIDFFDKLPDNREYFEKLKNIFNKTLTFTIAEKSEYDEFNVVMQDFIHISLEINNAVHIKPREVSGIVSANKLNLESQESFNLSKDHYCIVNKEKRVLSKFKEMMDLYTQFKVPINNDD